MKYQCVEVSQMGDRVKHIFTQVPENERQGHSTGPVSFTCITPEGVPQVYQIGQTYNLCFQIPGDCPLPEGLKVQLVSIVEGAGDGNVIQEIHKIQTTKPILPVVGTICCLKSGGCYMTVVGTRTRTVVCQWFDDDNVIHTAHFDHAVLKYPPSSV